MAAAGEVTLKPEELTPSVSKAILYVCDEFLGDKHYKMLRQEMATQWHSMSSLTAAVKLMEQYGVVFTEDDIDRMSQMDEAQQINSLISKMPQQSNDEFQPLFLQLQILVTTSSRIRKALEEGNAAEVSQALTEAESAGISKYILRMAIVQADAEVKTLKAQYQNWTKDAGIKMKKLIAGSEEGRLAQKKLAEAQGNLTAFLTGQNEKVKKVLIAFLGGNSSALQAAFFKEWAKVVKDVKMEREIEAEFAVRKERVQMKLIEFKAKVSGGIFNLMVKKGGAYTLALMEEIFMAWKQDCDEVKYERDVVAKAVELDEKMKNRKGAYKCTMLKYAARMNGQELDSLKAEIMQAWVSMWNDWKKLGEEEKTQEKIKKSMGQMIAKKKEGIIRVFSTMTAGMDVPCMKQALDAWKDLWLDAKREASIAEALAQGQHKMGQFSSRNKMSAMSATERAAYHLEITLCTQVMNAWKLDARMERALLYHGASIDSKRQQLVMVQQMFRNFSKHLETGLQQPPNSGRFEQQLSGSKKKLSKGEGSCSLPEINQRHTPK